MTPSDHTTSGRLCRVCAWCERVYVGGWLALEQALRRAGVSSRDELGPATHCICQDCYSAVAPAA
jgi:hypothetical protein